MSHGKQASDLLFCEICLVFYILNFKKFLKIFFKISLLYLKCFTKNPHHSPLTRKMKEFLEVTKKNKLG